MIAGGDMDACLKVIGRVIAIENQFVWVEVQPRSECPRCVEGKGCGAGNISQLFGEHRLTMRMENTLSAKLNDCVTLSIAAESINHSAFLMYGLPLLSFVLAAVLVSAVTTSESIIVGASLLALLAGFLPAYSRKNREGSLVPRLLGFSIRDAGKDNNCTAIPGSL